MVRTSIHLKRGCHEILSISKFIGAYYEGSLVGFVKLVFAEGRFANPGLDCVEARISQEIRNNALVAKAVELCTDKMHSLFDLHELATEGVRRIF